MPLNREIQHWTPPLGVRAGGLPPLVSRSLPMRRICEQMQQIAATRLLVIEGEPGTGKQLLTRHIRALRTTPGSFAVEEAANVFSGDESTPAGVREGPLAVALERAAQGTLLLRGIDELTNSRQVQLLRFIRSFETAVALGSSTSSPLPFQIVCAARQPLRAMVLAGKFMPELYYRLSAVCFLLPPLRERREDIPGLVQIFIEAFSRERQRSLQGLGPGALAILLRHRWPGNVRELESVVRAACLSAEGQWLRPIDLVILPLEALQPATSDPALPQDFTLHGVLRRHVQRVLKVCAGNKARAAARLGISRSTLYRMLDADSQSSLPTRPKDLSAHEEEILSHDPNDPNGPNDTGIASDEMNI